MAYTQNFQTILTEIRKQSDRLAAVIVHINDTYNMEGRGNELPGFPRFISTVRKLRSYVKRQTGSDRLLVVHSGDFLGPSRLGKKDKGAAMVELLNRAGVDFCTLGNHEFDYREHALVKSLQKARLKVVLSNVMNASSIPNHGIALWPTATQPLVALSGVVSKKVHEAFPASWTYSSPAEALKHFTSQTRHVPFHVVLSHAERDEDHGFREALTDCERTIVLGGHDHDIDWHETSSYTTTYKNLSNLQTVWVILLLHGGGRVMDLLAWNYEELSRATGGHVQDTAENLKELLRSLHDGDAAIIRKWLKKKKLPKKQEPLALWQSVSAPFFVGHNDPIPDDALAHRLSGLPYLPSFFHQKLTFEDFLDGSENDKAWIKSRLADVRAKNEKRVVRDFSKDVEQLEARDLHLRSVQTDFGKYVAECVRSHAGADFALLNSGSFRCDSQLPSALTVYDLEETFLYDCPKSPIIVVEMSADEIEALHNHGSQQIGEGGYPQVAGTPKPGPETSLVAISSYLLMNEKSLDGYDKVLAGKRGIAMEVWRQELSVKRRFTIKEAVLAQADNVPYAAGERRAADGPAKIVISLAKRAVDMFELMPKRRHDGPAGRNVILADVISKEAPALNPELEKICDELRAFVGTIGRAHAGVLGTVRLQSLRTEIENDRAIFEHNIYYPALFDAAKKAVRIHGY